MKNKNDQILLKKLRLTEAEEFFHLHDYPAVFGKYIQELNMKEEATAHSFTKRLFWLTEAIYTIRLHAKPEMIVGSALIYKGGKARNEFYFGGTLLPAYRGMGILLRAFEQIIELSKYCYNIFEVRVSLNISNELANNTMNKLGFIKTPKYGDLIYRKKLMQKTIA